MILSLTSASSRNTPAVKVSSSALSPPEEPVSATRPLTVRGVIDALLQTSWGRGLQVNGIPVAELADRSAWIEFTGTGPFSKRTLTPRSAAAEALLSGPSGRAVSQALLGAASFSDSQVERSNLSGIVVADTPEETALAWAANGIAEWNRGGTHPVDIVEGATAAQRADVVGALKLGWKLRNTAYAFQNDWITLGDSLSGQFRSAVADAAAGKKNLSPDDLRRNAMVSQTLVHEMEHDVTFAGFLETMRPWVRDKSLAELGDTSLVRMLSAFEPIRWMEEGGAEALTQWPGMAARIQEATGLPGLDSGYHGYDTQVHGIRRVLQLAGIDTNSTSARSEAVELLQGGTLRDAPRRLAERIVAKHGIDPARVDDLTRRIEETAPVSPYVTAVLPGKLGDYADRVISWLSNRRFARLEQYVRELEKR